MSILTDLSQASISSLLDVEDQGHTLAASILDALLVQATDCIAIKNISGQYLLINAAGANFLDRDIADIIGKTDFELFTPETAQAITSSDHKVMATGKTELIEDFLRPLNGKDRYFQAMKCPYTSPSGTILGIINVVRDVTEAKQAELALKQINQDLDQFASIIAHDLQAPVRKVINFAGMLEQDFQDLPDEAKDYLNRIKKTAQTMNSLIVDLLDLSRVNKSKLRYRIVNLKCLIEESILEVSSEDPGLRHSFELLNVDIDLAADAMQIRQLLINLFSNALKFKKSNQTPNIKVEASLSPFGKCLITIQDNGIGFDTQFLPQMFKAFERLHSSKVYPGSGIGLAICKRIVQRHHGQITAESKPGEGATFYIELPVTQD